MNFEDHLRQALRREPAPPGFAAHLITLAATQASPVQQPRPHFRRWALPSAFALTSAVVIGGFAYQHHEKERALEASRQLVTALSVTKLNLQKAQERIHRMAAKPVL